MTAKEIELAALASKISDLQKNLFDVTNATAVAVASASEASTNSATSKHDSESPEEDRGVDGDREIVDVAGIAAAALLAATESRAKEAAEVAAGLLSEEEEKVSGFRVQIATNEEEMQVKLYCLFVVGAISSSSGLHTSFSGVDWLVRKMHFDAFRAI